ncbi:MAG: hypothetical protein ABF633_03335 [Clostridium sp.]|uniref:hypothetical protein n=1 Tax=Clostridium sp. TaxID=1506 RepID=UPI0039EA9536
MVKTVIQPILSKSEVQAVLNDKDVVGIKLKYENMDIVAMTGYKGYVLYINYEFSVKTTLNKIMELIQSRKNTVELLEVGENGK